MAMAVGLPTLVVTILVLTFAEIRFGGYARRIGWRVFWLGLRRSITTALPAIAAFGATGLLPQWEEPLTRGVASGIAGYALAPGLARTLSLGAVSAIVRNIDRQIRETNAWDDSWLLRRDAQRLAASFTPRCLVEIYEHNLSFVVNLEGGVVRERAAILRSLLDDSQPFDTQIGPILRLIKNWGEAGWPAGLTTDGFILSLRNHGNRRLWENRVRKVVGMEPKHIERADDVVA